jgi:hypothetical protein
VYIVVSDGVSSSSPVTSGAQVEEVTEVAAAAVIHVSRKAEYRLAYVASWLLEYERVSPPEINSKVCV